VNNYIIRLCIIVPVLLIAILLSPFLIFGQANRPDNSENSRFCINCHVMQAEYEAWMHSGAHRRKMCVDCHLPNENRGVYYLWKSIDGLKDVAVFYSGQVPDRIKISSHGIKVLQSNCIRCHETTVMLMDTKRKCWDCHRRITHMHTGIRETL
jgi:cytochrome c nitrite reductase small subunit